VARYFASGDWREYVATLRSLYRARRDAMLDALAEHMPPHASWTHPQGGLFIWVTLPDYIDTSDLLARALAENVAFVPGEAAYDDGRGQSSMRLNFSNSPEDELREGVRRIAKIIKEQIALYEALTDGEADAGAGTPVDLNQQPLATVLELPPRRAPRESRRKRDG
jgi:2-aminoadipate transaminase